MMKILHNATIYTPDEAHPIASVIALDHDRIVTLGESDDLHSEFDGAEKQDMGGKTILPGLTNAHLDPQQYALSYAWQTQLDQGAKLAFGSDAPVELPNPFLGKVAPGYLADLIVLTRNPFVILPSKLLELEASATMIAGDWVRQS
jgi:predicted amidohydrolase YtcJ